MNTEDIKSGVIYKITNMVNGKAYIGQTTSFPPTKRFFSHLCGKSLLSRAMRKYGIANFDFRVIDTALTRATLNQKEIDAIKYCGSLSPVGYNVCAGGSFGDYKRTKGHCRKIAAALTGIKRSPETCARISAAKLGKTPRPRSKPMNRATRAKIAASRIGKPTWQEGKSHTRESRDKMAAAWTPERKANALKGKKHPLWGVRASEETRIKMSLSHIGLKATESTKKKMRESRRKRGAYSLASRQKISDSLKAYFASR